MSAIPIFDAQVASATEHIYEKVRDSTPRFEWELQAPLIHEINRLKAEKKAVILGHNYQVPAIFHGISDYTGDSLGLAYEAQKTDAEIIVFCGVHFMAETAKILSPDKLVLIPDPNAGCSLSESITPADVRALKAKYPGRPVVTYMNTPADIKAESDVVCTSANAQRVVEAMGADEVIFLPDEYLARNVAALTKVKVITWHGTCIVHDQFSVGQLEAYRKQYPGLTILTHPECSPEVVAASDYVGSTSGMINHLAEVKTERVLMVTECSMADNVQSAHPELEFVKSCSICPHMKRITLEKVLISLRDEVHAVEVPAEVQAGALRAVERMLEIGRQDENPTPV